MINLQEKSFNDFLRRISYLKSSLNQSLVESIINILTPQKPVISIKFKLKTNIEISRMCYTGN